MDTNSDRTTTAQQKQSTAGPHRPHHHHQRRTEETAPPPEGAPGGRAERLDNGEVKWESFGQTVYVRDATKHPPGASYTVAIIIGFFCLVAIFWQANTTFSAFGNMIFNDPKWLSLSQGAQSAARNPVNIICLMIAVSFQAPLIFMGFKIDKRWAGESFRQPSAYLS